MVAEGLESGDHGFKGLRAGGFEVNEEVEGLGGGGVKDAAVGGVNCICFCMGGVRCNDG